MKIMLIYLIHDNDGRPFEVTINEKNVRICTYFRNTGDYSDDDCDPIYGELIKNYVVQKVFIGKSTGFPIGGHEKSESKYFDGNSILLQLDKGRFVFIGLYIYEFTIDDEPLKYYSMVGYNDVPYPILLGMENVYFMTDETYVPRDKFPANMKNSDWEGAYDLYFDGTRWDGMTLYQPLKEYAKSMKAVQIVYERIE